MKKILDNLSIVIMAAGKGTRMNSNIPKVLYPLAGKSLLNHVVDTAESLYPQHIVIIIGYKSDLVKKSINKNDVYFSLQNEQKESLIKVSESPALQYLINNPDVMMHAKNIVNAGGIAPGRAYQQAMERAAIEHFNAFGRAEGRSGPR